MNILVITNMYPSPVKPYFGIFVQSQVRNLIKSDKSLNVKIISNSEQRGILNYAPRLLFNSMKALLTNKVDVIHVHFGLTATLILPILIIAKMLGVKLILTCHGSDVLGNNRVVTYSTRLVSRVFNSVIAVSKEIERELSFLGHKVYWLPCGIEDDFFQQNKPSTSSPYVVFPSDPNRVEKNFTRFEEIRALSYSKFDYKCLVGMNRNEVEDCLLNAKCLLMTSDYEGSPQTVKESLALGTPVVSTDVGDVSFILDGFKYSFVSDCNAELAKKIDALFLEKPRETYSKLFSEQYMNSSVTKKILSLYKK